MKKVNPRLSDESSMRFSLGFRLKATIWGTMAVLAVSTLWIWVQRAKADPQGPATTSMAPAASGPSTPGGADKQPPLPAYFAGLPAADPTGANYGVWATPSGTPNADGSPGGDVPSTLGITDLYDRVMHNQYALNIMWTLLSGA